MSRAQPRLDPEPAAGFTLLDSMEQLTLCTQLLTNGDKTVAWPQCGGESLETRRGTANANHGDWNRGHEEPQAKENISLL